MSSTARHTIDRQLLDEFHRDCKRWRRLVSRSTQSDGYIPPATEDEYKAVHGRILAHCRTLAEQPALPEFQQRAALELEELLHPWCSTKSLHDAPPPLLHGLLQKEASLRERLRGQRGMAMNRLKRLGMVAGAASLAGIAIVLFMEWASSEGARPLFESLSGRLASVVARLQRASFTEKFAVGVLFSWLFGTWLLSKMPKG